MCSPISTTTSIQGTARIKRKVSSIDAFLSNLEATTNARKKFKKENSFLSAATTQYVHQVRRGDDSYSDRVLRLPETLSSERCGGKVVPDSRDTLYRTIYHSGIFSSLNTSATTIQTPYDAKLGGEEERLLPKALGPARHPRFALF